MHIILSSQIMYLNACEWSERLKHAACIDTNNETRCG